MKRSNGLFFFVFAAAVAGTTCAAQAQATRTWVSGAGDDGNACSRTAPCKTWAGAISKTAAGGEIDAIDPGGFGALTITKAITIDGGAFASALALSGVNDFTIAAGPSDTVVLRNISFAGMNAAPNGIQMNSGLALRIEHCVVSGFTQYGANVDTNTAAVVTVVDSTFAGNQLGGLTISNSGTGYSRLAVDGAQFVDSFGGGGTGITVGTHTYGSIARSTMSNNASWGIVATGTGSVAELRDATISLNGVAGATGGGGVRATMGGAVGLANSLVTLNVTGLMPDAGGSIISAGTNVVTANGTNGAANSTISPSFQAR